MAMFSSLRYNRAKDSKDSNTRVKFCFHPAHVAQSLLLIRSKHLVWAGVNIQAQIPCLFTTLSQAL